MKAIRIETFQSYANYKMPGSHQLRETYPLPPYSTIIGMVHKACDFKSYVPMDVSIQGSYHHIVDEAFIRYEFKPEFTYDEKRHQVQVPTSKGVYGIGRGVGHVQLLIGVSLILHIVPQSEANLEIICNGLKKPSTFLSIGRHEDLLRVDSVSIVDLEEIEVENFQLKNQCYIPIDLFDQEERSMLQGTFYDLTKNYQIVNNRRVWDKRVEVIYVSADLDGLGEFYLNAYQDSEGNYVFLA